MRPFAAFLLALVLVPRAHAEPMSRPQFDGLVARLADAEAGTRDAAERELETLGDDWQPAFEEALKAAADPEARVRLERLLGRADRIRWRFERDGALAEARRLQRPLLVVCGAGRPEAPVDAASWKTLRVTLAGRATVRFVNESFVCLWVDQYELCAGGTCRPTSLEGVFSEEQLAQCDEGSDEMMFVTMVCNPDGTVRHAWGGWWPAATFRAECEKALGWALKTAEEGVAARNAALAAVHAEIARLEEQAAAGDAAARARVDAAKTLSRRYHGYGGMKIGKTLDAAIEEALEDYVGRELK